MIRGSDFGVRGGEEISSNSQFPIPNSQFRTLFRDGFFGKSIYVQQIPEAAMKIGCPNNPRRNLQKEIEWIGTNKFDFIDLFLEEDKSAYEKINTEKTRELLMKYGLFATGHTAWYLPFGSPMKALREAAISEASKYMEVFGRLGVRFVTVHAHWPGGMFSAREGISFQVESLKSLVEISGEHNIQLMYEPIDTPEDNLTNVAAVLRSVPELLFHLDIGHANLHGRTPQQFIREFHQRLAHVHLHDNLRNLDLHLPIGCGNIDWHQSIKTLKEYYDGTITLEIFSRDRDYLLLSREKLIKMWSAR